MATRVDVSRRAGRQIDVALDWWRSNRDKAPMLFVEELEEAFEILRQTPHAGLHGEGSRWQSVRRLLLPKTRYFLYYKLSAADHVRVIALWHQSRGTRPKM